jgi:hypothetical protein
MLRRHGRGGLVLDCRQLRRQSYYVGVRFWGRRIGWGRLATRIHFGYNVLGGREVSLSEAQHISIYLK